MDIWKRNLWTITAAETVTLLGFFFVMPFLPYYVQELGVTDPVRVKYWSSWLYSGQALAMALVAPIWGTLADRYGRKIMVERAIFAGAILFVAMGFVQNVEQLMALRVLQGCLTGSVTAAMALVAATTPSEHAGFSQGVLQTGVYFGISAGPLVGGILADTVGYRPTFWITGVFVLLAGLTVHRGVKEDFVRPKDVKDRPRPRVWDGLMLVFRSPMLRLVILVNMLVRLSMRIISPMLPLFVAEITGGTGRLATLTGLVSGAGTLASAGGSLLLGRFSDRKGQRKVLIGCILVMAVLHIPQAAVNHVATLTILQFATGFFMAGVLASSSAVLARQAPEGRHGAVFGVNSTAFAAANAIGPLLGAASAVWWGLRSVFLTTASVLVLACIVAAWLFAARGREQRELMVDSV